MEIKAGDYVRTEYGIFKIRDDRPFKDEKNKLNYLVNGRYTCVLKEDIKISSPNIIDLIEVGDYINSGKVYEKEKDYIVINADYGHLFEFMNVYKKDIKSIVTKEQFESMKYRIGD